MEVDGLNGNGLKERCLFTAETLRLSDVSAFRCQFRVSPLFFFRRDDRQGESDLVRRQWGECQKKASMQVRKGHGPEGKGEKRKQTATQKIKMKIRKLISEIPFRHERDSSEQGRRGAPDDGHTTLCL